MQNVNSQTLLNNSSLPLQNPAPSASSALNPLQSVDSILIGATTNSTVTNQTGTSTTLTTQPTAASQAQTTSTPTRSTSKMDSKQCEN